MIKTVGASGDWYWREDLLNEEQRDVLYLALQYYVEYGINAYDQTKITLAIIATALDSLSITVTEKETT